MALELVARREVSRVRSAEPKWNAKTLRVSDRNICAEFTRRLQQREGKNVRGNDDKRAGIVRLLDEAGIIVIAPSVAGY